MHDGSPENLLFQALPSDLERYATRGREPVPGPPELPPPKNPFGQPWENPREPNDRLPLWDLVLTILAFAVWLLIGAMVLESLIRFK